MKDMEDKIFALQEQVTELIECLEQIRGLGEGDRPPERTRDAMHDIACIGLLHTTYPEVITRRVYDLQ